MTNLYKTIKAASEAAYIEDATQIVGMIEGEWAYANTEDAARIHEMESSPRLRVNGPGLIAWQTAQDLNEMDDIAEQDWDSGTTTWTFKDGSQIRIDGAEVMILGEQE